MHVVIAGCGRVGSGLARDLVSQGFDVAIIDESPDSFHLLGDDFPGRVHRRARAGLGRAAQGAHPGRHRLRRLHRRRQHQLVVRQIAQKNYGIKCVVARVYDPLRAELFAQAGIRTVCPTRDVRVSLFDAVRSCQLPVSEG